MDSINIDGNEINIADMNYDELKSLLSYLEIKEKNYVKIQNDMVSSVINRGEKVYEVE